MAGMAVEGVSDVEKIPILSNTIYHVPQNCTAEVLVNGNLPRKRFWTQWKCVNSSQFAPNYQGSKIGGEMQFTIGPHKNV